MKTVVSTLEIGDRRLSSPDFIMFLEDVCKYVREDYKSRVGDAENTYCSLKIRFHGGDITLRKANIYQRKDGKDGRLPYLC